MSSSSSSSITLSSRITSTDLTSSTSSDTTAATNTTATTGTTSTTANQTTTPPTDSTTTPPTSGTTTTPSAPGATTNTTAAATNTSSTSTKPVSTVIQTSFITTNAQGSTTLVTSLTTVSSSAQTGSASSSNNSSKTGAIAGGVVGGLAALVLLVLLGWCLARRRRNNNFDGDFDPDHVGGFKRGHQDLVPDGPSGDEVTPYPLNNNVAHPEQMAQRGSGGFDMAAAGLGLGALGGAAAGHRSHDSHDARTYSQSPVSESEYPQTESSFYPNHDPYAAVNAAIAPHHQGPMTQGSSSVYSQPTTSQPRSQKEREAYTQRSESLAPGALHVANSSPDLDERSSNILVHQDGGRIPQEEHLNRPQNEIPPTYDSLPRDEPRQ